MAFTKDNLNFVFLDDAEYHQGTPVNCKGVISGCQESSLVKYLEYCPARQSITHRGLSGLGARPGYLVFGLYGNPTNWSGTDGTASLISYLPRLPQIMEEHPGLRLLIDYSFEAGLGEWFFVALAEFVATLNVDPARIVVLVANHGVEARYAQWLLKNNKNAASCCRIIGEDFWLMFSGLEYSRKHWGDVPDRIVSTADVDQLRMTTRQKKFLSLNRRPRWHRFLLGLMLGAAGLRHEGIVSMPSANYEGDWVSEDHQLDMMGKLMAPEVWRNLADGKSSVFETLPWVIDIEMGKNSGQPEQFLFRTQARDLFLNTYMQIVTETAMEGERGDIFITEKTCKAIANLQPFVVFGQSHHLRRLAHHGFAPSTLFDTAYDTVDDLGARLNHLYAVLARIRTWSVADTHAMYYDDLPRLQFNQQRLFVLPAVIAEKASARLSAALWD